MFEAEVAKGAEWLDEYVPGWEHKIDLGKLEMVNCSECVIGQTLGFYFDFERIVGGWARGCSESAREYAVACGFNLPIDDTIHAELWDALRDTWISLIKERYNTGNLSDS